MAVSSCGRLGEKPPGGKLGSDKPEERFVQKLLEDYVVEGPVFWAVMGLVPTELYAIKDPKFAKDYCFTVGRGGTDVEVGSASVEEIGHRMG